MNKISISCLLFALACFISSGYGQDGVTDADRCPVYAPFFGSMGITAAIVFTVMGSAYGTAKSGVGISSMGVMHPEFAMKAIVPVIFAGAIGIYGLIQSVVLLATITEPQADSNGQMQPTYSLRRSFLGFGSGLSVGLCGLGAGMCIGIVGDAGVRAAAQQQRLYVTMIIILIFAEALALYGFIVGVVLGSAKDPGCTPQ